LGRVEVALSNEDCCERSDRSDARDRSIREIGPSVAHLGPVRGCSVVVAAGGGGFGSQGSICFGKREKGATAAWEWLIQSEDSRPRFHGSETELRTSTIEMRISMIEMLKLSSEMNKSEIEMRNSMTELRISIVELRISMIEPLRFVVEIQRRVLNA
jgi:hypothetical protein